MPPPSRGFLASTSTPTSLGSVCVCVCVCVVVVVKGAQEQGGQAYTTHVLRHQI
jgi:hypothetical protein